MRGGRINKSMQNMEWGGVGQKSTSPDRDLKGWG
jgi:hypothetical protein